MPDQQEFWVEQLLALRQAWNEAGANARFGLFAGVSAGTSPPAGALTSLQEAYYCSPERSRKFLLTGLCVNEVYVAAALNAFMSLRKFR